jgi:spore coat polysaccharide biosynthesis protein SpsF
MNLGIIIQARMGSSRLPGKVLMPIAGKELLDHILVRLSFLSLNAKVIVATTIHSMDDCIENFCSERAACFRGSELDVLDRYFQCATLFGFSDVVRLTADNPFTDIDELHRLIKLHLQTGCDYCHSFGSLPIGVGAEIFTFSALERSHREGQGLHHREHVNEYILERPTAFNISLLDIPKAKCAPDLRLTVDTQEDYLRACNLAEAVWPHLVTTEEAIKAC